MVLERLEEAAATLDSIASSIRRGIRPAETIAENRANTAIYTISEAFEELALALRRLKCIADAKGIKDSSVVGLCTTWRLYESDGGLVLLRIKPETVIAIRDGHVTFHRDVYKLEAEGATVKLCKWNYCKTINPLDREKIMKELPQIFYLLRSISNMVRKTAESIQLCARREAAECARL
ncbi:hypothetical protein [Hyperthermus butylicus]|uniref:Uncharacterized protein n=1 Tax=Hyperthermus butylicus (strain DSM 5456 / JCM 9403 / PLM1-5) TaxID=415426 RepID=A2BL48_HYPBU|nr:hypothetical protein [Hyperthermus butylicus]ABM80709.1 hypothetical protein Hbut_0858 [Hyperthermus butylicus DSM 5456]